MKNNKRIRKAIIAIITIALLETSIYAENTISTDKTENQGTNTVPNTNTATQQQDNTSKEQTPVTTPEKTETQEQKQEEKKEEAPVEQTKQEQTEQVQPQEQEKQQEQEQEQQTQVEPAKNQNTQQTYNTSTTTRQTNKVETPKAETTSAKSSNASLSNLGITPHDFSGFKEEKTEYNVTVPNELSEIEIYATKKDSKASIEGTGKVKLQEGENIQKVVVKAEDGTTKTYTITINRLKSGETETVASNNLGIGLKKLEFTGFKLEPDFNEQTYQYKLKYEGSEKQLKIITEAYPNTADVKIIGNENLINGQNIVTIVVTDEKEENVVTYQVYVNKNMVEPEEIDGHYAEARKKFKIKYLIIIALAVIIAISIIILLILLHKKRKHKKLEEEHNLKKDNNISKNKKGKSGRHSK